jgi:hypothetical protein
MHSSETVQTALRLRADEGLGARRIARRLHLPVATVRDWLAGRIPQHSVDLAASAPCDRCGGAAHDFDVLPREYVYLLGLYLGDGSIATHPRAVYKLRITLDTRYPGIIASAAEAIAVVRGVPANPVRRRRENCVDVSSYWKCWPCLLPQHGAGRKHERAIRLTDWQVRVVDQWPGELVKGLIHSDGCRFINTGRGWVCPRYAFAQKSDDIRDIFCGACDRIGVRWTRSGTDTIYVSHKADVAYLDTFIGPKR